ncbi:ubiquinol-cytochrome c reductase iron-sulfur subunit [Zhaonella formicivorans]|jgi:Rieske Fe-S protein|uniref:QcrA and Rieske domain-containing protein n=1 Tax=Zhaonella formicivorans TaxID=2528593 RepID=UPI0010CFDD04|nr:Rieske (2Fe-2S) protein [Zhaonella formicivorans]
MDNKFSRRKFISLCFSILGFFLFKDALSFLTSKTGDEQEGMISFGRPEDYPAPGVYKGNGAWLVRDARGFFALNSRCSHLGCSVVEWDEGRGIFICPCHNSKYGLDGSVLEGPAAAPLKPVQVTVDGKGNIVVDLKQQVPKDSRLAV